jgi:hypothetical protein
MAVGGLLVAAIGGLPLLLVSALSPTAASSSPSAVADIPTEYLVQYRSTASRFGLGPDGWSYLAAIGAVESDHGRSAAPGVRSGQNAHGCCAGPMQIHNGFGSGAGTRGRFRTDGDGDGRLDIYAPGDAIHTAARYLSASGAPADWRSALFAYNHSTSYVDDVVRRASSYRAATADGPPALGPVVTGDGTWLAPVPDHPGERCDARIVPDVTWLVSPIARINDHAPGSLRLVSIRTRARSRVLISGTSARYSRHIRGSAECGRSRLLAGISAAVRVFGPLA